MAYSQMSDAVITGLALLRKPRSTVTIIHEIDCLKGKRNWKYLFHFFSCYLQLFHLIWSNDYIVVIWFPLPSDYDLILG